ncbi:MAG: DUF7594 domain-containing protein, partial [Anaerolineales bacterium]
SFATLSVPIDPKYSGNENLDMELRSSPDTNWAESTLTWSTQPDLDPDVLATAASTVAPNDALFTSSEFASYLNDKKGQMVSLVVKANCNGNVAVEATRVIAARENTNANPVELILQGPTNVGLSEMKAVAGNWNGRVIFFGILLGIYGAYVFLKKTSYE